MYYLQSRYYDPAICRFISADAADIIFATPMALTDKNLYAYCDNNPVIRVDGDGEFWNYVIGAVVGAVIGGVLGWITAEESEQDGLTGALTGAALGATVGIIVASGNTTMISGGLSSLASKTTTDLIGTTIFSSNTGTWEDYAVAFIFGSISKVSSEGVKTALDVAIRPAFNQTVKMHTRGDQFDAQKYTYDVITRGISSGKSHSLLIGCFGELKLEVDLFKCFIRATTRGIYSYTFGE